MNLNWPIRQPLFWLRIGVTVACLGALYWRFHASTSWQGWQMHRPVPFFLGVVLVIPLLWVRAWKWCILLRTCAPQATWGAALRSYLGALPLSLITPGKAGELVRGFYLPYPETRGLRAAGLTVIDNWTDFAAVAWWTIPILTVLGGWAAGGLGIAACLLLCAIPLWLKGIRNLAGSLPLEWRITGFWNRFWPESAQLGWKPASISIGIGVIAYGIEWLQMSCFLSALGGKDASFFSLAGNMALVQWANSIQITIAGLGVREGSTAWLLNRSGWDMQLVLVSAFFQTTVSLLLPALAGLFIKPLFKLPTMKGRA